MSIELTATIKAIDEASDKLKQVGENTEKAMKKVEDSTKKADFSFKQFTVSISGVMTAGFALYNAYDRIQDSQLAVKKAQDALTSAQISAKDAQEAYNRAVEKYGVDSDQARDALEKLQLAQDKVKTANEILEEKQSRVNEALVNLAVQGVPVAITAISNLKGVVVSLTGAFESAKVAIASVGASLGLLGGMITGVGAILGGFYLAWVTDFDGIRTKTTAAMEDVKVSLDGLIAKLSSTGSYVDGFANICTSAFERIKSNLSDLVSDINASLDEIINSFKNTQEEIVGGSIWPDMWESITETTKEGLDANIDEIDRGLSEIRGLLKKPFYMEVVLTVNAKNIKSQVAAIINEVLKSVVIEKTSAGAVTSRIRVPTTTTTTTTGKSPMLTVR